MHSFKSLFKVAIPLAAIALVTLPLSSLTVGHAAPQAAAQDVYLDKCAICHGKDGAANTAKGRKLKVKDVRSPDVQKLSEAEMVDIVAKGKGKDMDGFEKELGKDIVKQLVAYYRSLAKP